MYRNGIKRFIDFLASFLGFVIFLPVFLVVTLLLTVVNQGNPFFIQHRPGKDRRIFKVIKFKTMNDRKGLNGELLPDVDRLTPIGSFVRKTSLDEIPQLLNVIKGDMSLVGPRPLLVEYLPLYDETQIRRHEVRPGITGWAQVNGRNAISWKQKFAYDIWYVDNVSFAVDAKILFMTVQKVLKSEGINEDGQITMTKFKGNE